MRSNQILFFWASAVSTLLGATPSVDNERIADINGFGSGQSVPPGGWSDYPAFTFELLPDDLAERMQMERPPFVSSSAELFTEFSDERDEGIFQPDGGYLATRQKSQRLGGFVNMSNRSGLDYDGFFASVQGQARYYDVVEDFDGRPSWRNRVRLATQLGADESLGVFFYAQQRRYYFGADGLKNDWGFDFSQPVNSTNNPLFLDEYQVRHSEVERERYEYGLNFNWEPTEDTQAYLRLLFVDTQDIERRDAIEFDSNSDGRAASAIFDYTPATDVRGDVLESATMRSQPNRPGQSRLEHKLKDELEEEERWGFDTALEHRFERGWLLRGSAQFARRDKREPDRRDSEYRHRDSDFSYRYSLGGDSLPDLDYVSDAVRDQALDPANILLDRIETEDNRRLFEYRQLALELDSGKESFESGRSWSGGVAYTRQRKVYDQEYLRFQPAGGAPLSAALNADSLPPILGNDFGPRIDPDAARGLATTGLQELESTYRSTREDYNGDQVVQAVFWAESYQRGDWSFHGGVRAERTEFDDRARHIEWNGEEPSGNPFFPGGQIFFNDPQREQRNEVHLLPALAVRYQPRPELIIRAQWSNALARPRAEERAPLIAIDEDDGEEPSVEAANSGLDIDEIMHFDFSVDWQNRLGSFFSAGAFHRRHESPILRHGALATADQIRDGLPLGDSPFQLNQPRYRVQTFLNAEDGEATGFRLNAYQRFDFLPGFLDGFGVLANYRYTDSRQDVSTLNGNQRRTNLQETPEHFGNMGLFYRRDGLFATLVASYASEQLDSIGGTADGGFGTGDRWVDARTTLDFSLEYNFSRQFEVFFEVRNLSNEPFLLYEGDSRRVVEYLELGREFLLGFQYKF